MGDYFKTFLFDMPQEVIEMIRALAALYLWILPATGYGISHQMINATIPSAAISMILP